VGLVAFSGEAQTLVPLTLDYGTVQLILRDLEPGWLLPGTDLAAAIDKGLQMFRRSKVPSKYAVMVLMSDGEEQDAKAVEKAKEAAEAGIRIYTVGIGSKEGVPIPEPSKNGDVSYHKDRFGNIVTTHLEEKTLQDIAGITGARYFYASPGEFQLQKVLSEIQSLEKRDTSSDQVENYQDRYQIFLAIAALLFLAEALLSERGKKRKQVAGRFS
jgi:Ca-activated chloride channel family protein